MVVTILGRKCCWHLVGQGQISFNAQDSPHHNRYLIKNNSDMSQNLCTAVALSGNVLPLASQRQLLLHPQVLPSPHSSESPSPKLPSPTGPQLLALIYHLAAKYYLLSWPVPANIHWSRSLSHLPPVHPIRRVVPDTTCS